jgi:hypothetical protein
VADIGAWECVLEVYIKRKAAFGSQITKNKIK